MSVAVLTKIQQFLMSQLDLAGIIVLVHQGQVEFLENYGFAERETQRLSHADTIFPIASLTKSFTGMAITRLIAQGLINPAQPITEFFPHVPPDKQAITLQHLLTHTCGLADVFEDDFEIVPRALVIKQALQSALMTPPGTTYFYYNTGYSMLAMILEQVTGQSYEAFLNTHFFTPLGMASTGYMLPDWTTKEFAIGYLDNERWGTLRDYSWDSDGPSWNLRGNGGILSSINDMVRLHLGFDQIMTPQEKRILWGKQALVEAPNIYYGYGWYVAETQPGGLRVGHVGGDGIFNAIYRHWLETEWCLVAFSNDSRVKIAQLVPQIQRLLFT